MANVLLTDQELCLPQVGSTWITASSLMWSKTDSAEPARMRVTPCQADEIQR